MTTSVSHGKPYAGKLHVRFDEGAGVPDEGRPALLYSSRSPTGVATTYAYDALGRQISQTDGRGNTSQIVYDAQGRVAKTIDPLGNETAYAYDVLGRQVAVTDPLGHTVTTAYDAEGRVLAQRGATYPVDYAYDAYGNKVAMTTYRDEALTNGDTTHWLYDEPSGCMTNKLYADGKGPSYSYTPDGKLARRTWARGIATDYTYDNAGQLVSTTYSDNTPTITMSYDRVGNLTEATTVGVVTNIYAYDFYGHCTNEWQNDFQLTRFYDTLGRNTGYAINGTRQTAIAYDSYGRIATMTTATGGAGVPPAQGGSGVLTASNGGEFTWAYLPGSDLKASLQYPNGLTANWTYDANNQLLQVRNATPTNVISQFDYTYDAAGRRTAIAKTGTAFGDLSGSVDAYTYNARSELTSARRTKNGQPIPGFSEDFDYDPIGNRRSSATYNEKGEPQTSTYQANNLNQYVSCTTPGYAAVRGEADPNAFVTVNGNDSFRLGSYYFGSDLFDNSTAGGLANLETYATLSQAAANGDEAEDLVSTETNQVYIAQSPETFAYDDDGNQTLITTKTGLWRVTYNGENRPILWVRDSDNTTLTMTYDHMGRRRVKNGRRFFYDGYLQVYNIYSPASTHNSNCYMWDPTEPVATRPLYWQPRASGGNVPLFYDHDGNKNVSDILGMNGGVAAHYDYAPFGAVMAQLGTFAVGNSWRFSSEYADEMSGTTYFNYRHYVPREGRWLSRDYMEEEQSYLYIENAPLNSEDRLGLTKCSKWDEKTIGISAHGSVYGGEGAFDGRAKKSSPKNWHPVDTGAKLFDVLRSNSSKDGPCCSCIKNLQIHSHANGSGISMRWDSGMFVQKPEKISDKQGLSYEQRGVPGAARDVMDLKREVEKENIIFCKSCKIVLYGCWTGQDNMLAQELSKVVKCSVIAPMGPASAANKKGKRIASPADGTETRGFCADGWAEWRNGKKTSASSPIYGE